MFEGAFRLNTADPAAFALSDHLPQLAVFGLPATWVPVEFRHQAERLRLARMEPGHELGLADRAQVGAGEQGEGGEDRRQSHDGEAVVRDLEKALGDVGGEGSQAPGSFS